MVCAAMEYVLVLKTFGVKIVVENCVRVLVKELIAAAAMVYVDTMANVLVMWSMILLHSVPHFDVTTTAS
jgi:hypothetical protein